MTAYIVTDGDYSDYHIIGVFSNEERAQKAINVIQGAQYYTANIEKYEIDEIGKNDRYMWLVNVKNNGATAHHWQHDLEKIVTNKVKVMPSFINNDRERHQVYVLAENKEYAIKIASDLVRQFKANQ